MSRSLWKTLLALAALVAVLGIGACGGGDEEASDGGGTPAKTEDANVTEKLFARQTAAGLAATQCFGTLMVEFIPGSL